MLKILIIPANDWVYGPKQYFHDLSEVMAEKHDVFIWHFNLFRNSKPCFQKVEKVKLLKSLSVYVNNLFIYYVLNFIFHSLFFTKIVRELKIDAVIVLNLIPALWAFTLAPRRTLKIFGLQDYYPESVSPYCRNSPKIIQRLVETLAVIVNKLCIQLADVTLSPCLSLVDLSEKMGCKESYLLPNGVDSNFFNPSKRDEIIRGQLGLSAYTIVFYGLVENWLDFETVFDGIKILKTEAPYVKLLIIGSTLTGYSKELKRILDDKNLVNDVILTGYVPNELVPFYLNLGTICLMPYRLDTYSGQIRLPLKFFIYSAMGKPILSVPLPEVERLKPKHVFYYYDKTSFADSAGKILNDEKLRKELENYARSFAANFDYSKLAERCEEILERIRKRKQR